MDKRPHADRDPDAGFERLLREALREDAGAAGSECIEPDVLAAWSEGALSPSERSFLEAHAARCARCQGMLAVMARSVPVDPAPAAWSVRRWMMMLAPAAAAAAAAALWFAVGPRPSQLHQPAEQVAAVRDGAPPTSAAAPVSEESRASGDRRDLPSSGFGGRTASAAKSPAADARERSSPALVDAAADASRRAAAESGRRQELDRLNPEFKKETRDTRPLPSSPPPPPPAATEPPAPARPTTANTANTANANAAASPEVNAPPPVAMPAPGGVATTVTSQSPRVQTTQAPPPQQAAAPPDLQQQQRDFLLGAGGAGRGGQALERAGLNASVVVGPLIAAPANGTVQWRVVNSRIVQHSADGGATWATQYTLDDKSIITAGSSPTPLVAWFVGRAGLVIATTDGRTWRRVAFPEPIDLVSVLAIDARTATVATADRRSFTTTSGGASWTVKE